MAADKILDGVIAMNKPVGMSSAQVIRDCQEHFNPSRYFAPAIEREQSKRKAEPVKIYNRRSRVKKELKIKMGHGGTLDPLASGVLILGINGGTKSLQSFLSCTKSYETTIVFGAATDSYDRVGRILMRRPYEHITKEKVLKALEDFRGRINQTPPIYSALKMNGKPLYEYAREGRPIPREIPTREVDVQELELVEWLEPGTHKHFWPKEEAGAEEQELVNKLWNPEESQEDPEQEQPEEQSQEEKEEADAIAAHEAAKRKFDTDVDELVKDRPQSKRPKLGHPIGKDGPPMMSGALGGTANTYKPGKGSNLIPQTDETAQAPWEGLGPPAAKIKLTVSSGFYVRSFCHDLGLKLGSAALMAELSRSRQGDFSLGGPNCLEYDDLEKGEEVWAPKIQAMLEHWAANFGNGHAIRQASSSQVGSSQNQQDQEAETERVPTTLEETAEPQSVEAEQKDEAGPMATAEQGDLTDKLMAALETQAEDDKSWNGIQD